MVPADLDIWHMARAIELAESGRGHVEPNPLVGCVVTQEGEIVGEGWHRRFGGPHAEVEALAVAGGRARGSTLYVTLEPCCHQGKTPPCTESIVAAGVRRAVVAIRDPFPQVDGGGIDRLRKAGIEVELGLLESEARRLNAPYLKLVNTGRPWIIAKWAMTLDGKLATSTGDSRWISGEHSRKVVHVLRGRVDAIAVGRGTADRDDPLLTARPAGPRVATRVVLDTNASLSTHSRLVQTAAEVPVMVAVGASASSKRRSRLTDCGCEVFGGSGDTPDDRLAELLDEMGRRRWTNVLVEGGGTLLGSLFDLDQIDEVHAFIAPKLIGGVSSSTPLAGRGIELMAEAARLAEPKIRRTGDDLYVHGFVDRLGA